MLAWALPLTLAACGSGDDGSAPPLPPDNQLPIAQLSVPTGTLSTGTELAFASTGSTDPDGRLTGLSWRFGDGSATVTQAVPGTLTHTYTAAGTYAVQLTVTDDRGASRTAAATITVGTSGPPAASVLANLVTPITGQEVRLDPAASAAGGAAIVRYDWAFGDGRMATSTTPDVQYVSWPAAGVQTVRLTVTDSAGASNVAALVVTVASFAPTGRLNDSGMDLCSSNVHPGLAWLNNLGCSSLSWVGHLWGTMQDAYFGRDAQARDGSLAKIGRGAAGFDFTRLGSDGLPLAIQDRSYSDTGNEVDGTRWDCLRDNTTGLIWEVKRNDPGHLRHMGHTYSWYSTDSGNNGGSVGTADSSFSDSPHTGLPASCAGLTNTSRCNTQRYRTAVNALPAGQALCGFRDWRLPTADELEGLVRVRRMPPTIDADQFPNTGSNDLVWSSSPDARWSFNAWAVDFNSGGRGASEKANALQIRLVRSGQ